MNAYALKKIAPRLLIGIILINISIYLVVGMADLTRVLGRGVGDLITAPFNTKDNYNFTLGDFNGKQLGVVAITGFFVGRVAYGSTNGGATGGIQQIVRGIFGRNNTPASVTTPADSSNVTRAETFKNALHAIIFSIILPAAILFFAIMITLVFRQGLLILLAVTAPIACILYILPNTEKFAKKWLELYWKTLLMYPIIMIIFAISDILASIIFNNNADKISGLLAGLIAMFAPLALIPFSFKFAGGALGAIYGAVTSGQAKLGEMGAYKRNKEQAKHWWGEQKVEGQVARMHRADEIGRGDRRANALQRFRAKNLANSGGRGRIIEADANLKAEQAKRAAPLIQYGDEQFLRAVTATKQKIETRDRAGNVTGYRMGYKSLDGREVSEGEALAARKLATGNEGLQRAALVHAMNKTSDPSEYADFYNGLSGFQQAYNKTDHDTHLMLDSAGQEANRPEFRRTETRGGLTYERVDKTIGDMSAQSDYQAVASAGADERLALQDAAAVELYERREAAVAAGTPADQALSHDERVFLTDYEALHERLRVASQRHGGTDALIVGAQQATGQPVGAGAGAQTAAVIERGNTIAGATIVDTTGPEYDPPTGPPPPPEPLPPPPGASAAEELAYQRELPLRRQQRAEWDRQVNARANAEARNQQIRDARRAAKEKAASRNVDNQGVRLQVGNIDHHGAGNGTVIVPTAPPPP